MPAEVMCQLLARKQVSRVFQFQSIYSPALCQYIDVSGSSNATAEVKDEEMEERTYRDFASVRVIHSHTAHAAHTMSTS